QLASEPGRYRPPTALLAIPRRTVSSWSARAAGLHSALRRGPHPVRGKGRAHPPCLRGLTAASSPAGTGGRPARRKGAVVTFQLNLEQLRKQAKDRVRERRAAGQDAKLADV